MLKIIRKFISIALSYKESKKLEQEMTFVFLPFTKFDSNHPYSKRLKNIMRNFAKLNPKFNVFYIDLEPQQTELIRTPYTLLPNLKVVAKGTNIRNLCKGRLIYWMTDASFSHSAPTSGANLIIYDSFDTKDYPKWDVDLKLAEEIADIIIVPDSKRAVNHRKDVYILDLSKNYKKDIKKLLNIIKNTPNRKALLS